MTDSLLTEDWIYKLANYRTLFAGFSGGLDSTVLLHSLAMQPELRGKVQAVHVHHGLSVNAAAWQARCLQFCENLGLPLIVRQVEFDRRANIEEGARIARYQVFSSLLADKDALLLAHHCDDQAETLLLQLFRGAGIDGLSAMAAINALTKGELARPFLHHSRQTLESYAHHHQLTWVEDESNQNVAFSRNYLRHIIMPLLQEKWPGVVGNLARSATHCQQAKINLEALATMDCEELVASQPTLNVASLKTFDHARLANILRIWLRNNKVRLPSVKILDRLINEVILASVDAIPVVQWGDTVVRRYQQTLYLLKHDIQPRLSSVDWSTFPAPLQLDGGQYLYASSNETGIRVPAGCHVQVRFRQGAEVFYWRGQTKQLKKLWQQWRVPPWQRELIPLLYINNELAAVVGFAVSDHHFSSGSNDIYQVDLR